jgi:sugar phosphate permease
MPAPLVAPAPRPSRLPAILSVFAPAPPAEVMLSDPAEIKAQYRYWQRRILLSSLAGYAMFYVVRKNLSVAMPGMGHDLGIGKADLGLFLTLHGLLYGVSKFANGFLGDRSNARTFLVAGLLLSAVANICFGFSSTVLTLGLFWMLNGWVQGMGFPPCARLMAHWFKPKELATYFTVWNTSHSIGAGLVVVLCGYLAPHGWRLCFFVPAGMAIAAAGLLLVALRDTPPSLGLPEVEGTEAVASPADGLSSDQLRLVFGNPYIWLLGLASFFIYIVRYAVLDWGPTMLMETKGIKVSDAGWMVAAFEVSGVVGMLVSGWLTDRFFGGRGARLCVFSMLLTAFAMFLFWRFPTRSFWLSTSFLCLAGFSLYGPQALVGVVVTNLATKRFAATAVGLTSIFSYASTLVSGWGLGALVQHYGWNAALAGLTGVGIMSALLFALVWPAKAHGYATAPALDRVPECQTQL